MVLNTAFFPGWLGHAAYFAGKVGSVFLNSIRFRLFCTPVLLCILVVGCDSTDQILESSTKQAENAGKLTAANVSAGEILSRCIQRYSQLSSYTDKGKVKLRYTLDGKRIEDVAPLAVAFERPNRLGIRAYRIKAGVHQDRWRMRIGDEEDTPTPKQVVSRNIPEKATLEWLNSDLVAGQYLSAGMGGFPPQIDLLLSLNPLKGLVDKSAIISLGGAELIGEASCYIVQIVQGQAEYRLWIDQDSFLVRRMEMPRTNLPPAMLQDSSVKDISLWLDFEDCQADRPVDWTEWAVPEFAGQQLVSHFVLPPPPLPTKMLGQKMPAIRLHDPAGKEIINTGAGTAEKIHVLLWMADHPASRASALQLAEVVRGLSENLRERVHVVAVWAEPNPPRGATMNTIAAAWNLPFSVAFDSQAIGRDVFSINEAPTLIVLDSENRLQIHEERGNPLLSKMLPSILQRLSSGENLALAIKDNVEMDQERYDSELWMASAIDADPSAFQRTEKLAPRLVKLNLHNHVESTQEILALSADQQQMLWTLRADGNIELADLRGQVKQTHATEWRFSVQDGIRMQLSADGQYVAAYAPGVQQIDIMEVSSQTRKKIQLNAGQQIVGIHWLAATELQTARLLVLTSNRQTLLIDPNNQRQMSGLCQADPLAFIPHSSSADSRCAGVVVLADRRVEPLIMDESRDRESNEGANLIKPASVPIKIPSELPSTAQLQFQPGAGPWSTWQDNRGQATLALGWIALNEPAVYMLNSELQQQWHYRLPLTRGDQAPPMIAAARDPISGQPMFLVTQPNKIIHLLRADGQVNDHFQLDQPIRGLALLPVGDQLRLVVAHPHSIDHYSITPQ